MDSDAQVIDTLQGEIIVLLQALDSIYKKNSRGKTKQIADEIQTILKYYNWEIK